MEIEHDAPLNFNFLSHEQRSRRKRETLNARVSQLRSNLPIYNLEQIIEHRIPFYEARLINIRRKGLDSAANFIEDLVTMQIKTRNQAPAGSYLWTRPLLKDSKDKLDYLSQQICKAEVYRRKEQFNYECHTLLMTAVHFTLINKDWWWLAEQLLNLVIRIALTDDTVNKKYEAIARFVYAKYLIEEAKEYGEALEQLNKTRELAEHRGWTIKEYLPEIKKSLIMVTNSYIYECYMKEAQGLLDGIGDLKTAIELAELARKRAAEACLKNGEIAALMLKGNIALKSEQVKLAINSFKKALKMQENLQNEAGMCEALIALSKAYMTNNADGEALAVLEQLENMTAKDELKFYRGLAYKNLGEIYLNKHMPEEAIPLMHSASKIFDDMYQGQSVDVIKNDLEAEMKKVHLMEALASGVKLFPEYIKLIIDYDIFDSSRDMYNLAKLLTWKDRRTPFFGLSDDVGSKLLGEISQSFADVKNELKRFNSSSSTSQLGLVMRNKLSSNVTESKMKHMEKLVDRKVKAFAHILVEASTIFEQFDTEHDEHTKDDKLEGVVI